MILHSRLSLYLLQNPHLVRGKRVLELGSGTGLVGLVASLYASSVTFTDLPDQLELLNDNITRNYHVWNGKCICQAISHSFGEDISTLIELGKYDIVLGSDIGYDISLLDPISTSISATLKNRYAHPPPPVDTTTTPSSSSLNNGNSSSDPRESSSSHVTNNDRRISLPAPTAVATATVVALLAEEVRWNDIYTWYKESLHTHLHSPPATTLYSTSMQYEYDITETNISITSDNVLDSYALYKIDSNGTKHVISSVLSSPVKLLTVCIR